MQSRGKDRDCCIKDCVLACERPGRLSLSPLPGLVRLQLIKSTAPRDLTKPGDSDLPWKSEMAGHSPWSTGKDLLRLWEDLFGAAR